MKAFEYKMDIEDSFNENRYDDFENKDFESVKLSELIKLCDSYCFYFTLTEQTVFLYNGLQYKKLMERLEPYLVTSFLTKEWYSYFTSDENKLKISVYYLNEQTKDILLNMFYDMFMKPKLGFNNPNESLPEDICFFRKDKSLFFGSVSHESIARFYVTEAELESCEIPGTFKELSYETISTYSGEKLCLWNNYDVTFSDK